MATPWTRAELDKLRMRGDPVADEAVAKIYARGEVAAVNDLLHHIVTNDQLVPGDLPPEVGEYLDRTDDLPPWYDEATVDRAQAFFADHGPDLALALICASLPSSYAAAKGVQVLVRTGQLGSYTGRRVLETAQFLMDIMEPGSFKPRGRAIHTIQRVRLLHAAIRHLVQAKPDPQFGSWNTAWGLPVNQEDLLGTLMAFAFVVGEPLPRVGLHIDERVADDYVEAWAVVGYLLGVEEQLIPHTLAEAGTVTDAIRAHQFAASSEGAYLTRSLLDFLTDVIPGKGLDHIAPVLIRRMIGDETADLIDLPSGPDHDLAASTAMRLLLGGSELLDHSALLGHIVPALARTLVKAVFSRARQPGRTPFAIPEQLVHPFALDADLEALRPG